MGWLLVLYMQMGQFIARSIELQLIFFVLIRFNLYLHDTPDHHLFGRDDRRFSSGCTRLHRLIEPAAWRGAGLAAPRDKTRAGDKVGEIREPAVDYPRAYSVHDCIGG